MKTLFTLITLLVTAHTFAQGPDLPTQYEPCSGQDRERLSVASLTANDHLQDLIHNEVLQNETSCFVSKPRLVHPAVCGTFVSQVDTFIVSTNTESSYTIVVDSSYSSCMRMRRIPFLKSLKYQPEQRPVPFP